MSIRSCRSALVRPLSWLLVLVLLATGCSSRTAVFSPQDDELTGSLSSRDWGKSVEVSLKSGGFVSGELVALDDSSLYVRPASDQRLLVVPRDQVAHIRIREEPGWLGMAAFFGIVAVAAGGFILAFALSGDWGLY